MFATLTKNIARFHSGIRRYGFITSLCRFTKATFNRWFRARLYVWIWNVGDPLTENSVAVDIHRYETPEELPKLVREALIRGDGNDFLSRMTQEFSDHGVLWVASINGTVAAYQWSRRGQFIKDWHFELTDRDVVIFSTVTFQEFRGRGIAPTTIAKICREEVLEGGRATADCMIWNTPSIRSFQKVGFTKFAERKPLPGRPN